MNIVSIIIYTLIGFIVLMVSVILWYKKEDILTIFFPNDWIEIEMLERNNNTAIWLENIRKKDTFEFKGGVYNIYDTKKGVPSYLKTVVYRSGRVGKCFYVEGNENPIDFRGIESTSFPENRAELLKLDIAKLWSSDKPFSSELFERYGFFIIAVIAVGVIWLVFGGK